MKKEIIFAIVAGGALGLLIAYGAWKANSLLTQKPTKTQTSQTTSPSPSENNPQNSKLALVKPSNQDVLTDSPTVVAGITTPNSYVVISGENSDNIVNSSDSGSFTQNIELTGGINQIKISTFDTNGNKNNIDLLVVYSSQFQSQNGISTSYLGTVTDISNSTIQIKNSGGEIQQISESANVNYIDTRNNVTKPIKASDLAIGDYLVAMGVKDTNNILNASRILVTDPLTATTRQAFYGIVSDDSGINKFVIKNPKTDEITTVTPQTGIKILGSETSFGKISNNEKVIAVGEFKNGTLVARTIEVLK